MKRKKVIGIVVLIAGIVLFLYSLNAKQRIAAAKGEAGTLTGFLPKNSEGDYIGGKIKNATEQYDTIVQILFVGGIILIVVGGGMLFIGRRKR